MRMITKCNPYKKNRGIVIRLYYLILALFITQLSYSQVSISGKISDENNEPIIGAIVLIKGTTIGTISNINGIYTIEAKEGQILTIKSVGYVTQEIAVSAASTQMDVVLEADLIGLEEVVVVGYGTKRKEDLTSAVASVQADEFNKGAVKDAGQLIQGKIAGVSITNSSGDPTVSVEVMLRGITSISSGSSPLVIIDGIPGDLNTVSPQDIESINVLKDGSSAAIYGTRGNNGVIIITTRKGEKNMPLAVEYSTYFSTQTYLKKAPFYTAADYRSPNTAIADTNYGYSTDWLEEISRTPFSQNHDLSVRGGTEKTQYAASFNYDQREGMIINSDYNKITSHIDITQSAFKDYLKVNVGLLSGASETNPINKTWPYRQALIRNPTAPVESNGVWDEQPDEFQYENPVALLNEAKGESKDNYTRFYGNLILTPVDGLDLKATLSRNYWNNMYHYYETRNHISTVRDNQNGYAANAASSAIDNLLELTADYKRVIGVHELNGLIGYSYQDNFYETTSMNNADFPTDFFLWNNIGAGEGINAEGDPNADMSSYASMGRLIGVFVRVNYALLRKYLLSASIRREGSTKFGQNYKWGNFPAIQAGWKISEEDFMKNLTFVNNLKLRASYGITGNEPGSPYLSLEKYVYGSYVFYNGDWLRTMDYGSNPNPNLRWEKKQEINIGLDFSVLDNRLSGNIDYYNRKTIDLLWDYDVATPPYKYSTILANVGVMENKGIEVFLEGVIVKTKDFKWISSVNYSTNENILEKLTNEEFAIDGGYIDAGYTGDPIQQATHRVYEGGAIGDFWGYNSVDIDSTGSWLVQNSAGRVVSIDSVGPEDKMVLGNGLPKHYLGWNNTIIFKNFDLSINMRGAFGYQILNFQRMFYENPTIAYNMLNTAHDLIYDKYMLNYGQEYVSYYIEDGDHWKIDNVTFGYNFNPKNIEIFKQVRISVTAMNLLTLTGYKGIDPEVSRAGLDPGNDNRDKFPTTRTYTLSLNVKF